MEFLPQTIYTFYFQPQKGSNTMQNNLEDLIPEAIQKIETNHTTTPQAQTRKELFKAFVEKCIGVPLKYGKVYGSLRVRAHASVIAYLKADAAKSGESMQKTLEKILLFHYREQVVKDLEQGAITTQGKYTPRAKKRIAREKPDSELTYEELKEKYAKKKS
jgi:hypothetical protein